MTTPTDKEAIERVRELFEKKNDLISVLVSALTRADQFIEDIRGFRDPSMKVSGWHQNSDLEPFDNFIDENITDDDVKAIKAALYAAELDRS